MCYAHCGRVKTQQSWLKVDELSTYILQHAEWKGDCLVWIGARNDAGYGITVIDGKNTRVHRAVLRIENGEWPDKALHTCDNPPCLLYRHLYSGSLSDNSKDAVSRGRLVPPIRRGMDNHNTVTTDEEVRQIVDMYRTGRYTQWQLADMFGVHQATVWRYLQGVRK